MGFPATIAGTSTPRVGLPTILKSFESFSFTVFKSGGVIVAAFSANAPYASVRFVLMCITHPDDVSHSDSGTDQVCAAAATNICLHAPPTRRNGSQFTGVEVLPPARCGPYLVSSKSA